MPDFEYRLVVPLILWSLLTVGIVACIIKNAKYRTLIVYAALIPALYGLLSAITNIQDWINNMHHITILKDVKTGFENISTSLLPLPALLAYSRLSKQTGKKNSRWLVRVGFYYVSFLISLDISATFFADFFSDGAVPDSLFSVIARGHGFFIVVFTLLLPIHWRKLNEKARNTLLWYTLAYLTSEITFLVINFVQAISVNTYYGITYALIQLPRVLSLIIVTLYAHTWNMDGILLESNSDSEFEFEDEADSDDDNDNSNDNDNNDQGNYDATDAFLPAV
ncbi:uncharacterized protein EV154DRAFT_489425 [Mucor mucedo]|uniref:uncharacterized protein n=1 Tax=Mucor mucedo TaxID=29922 RepID=UPI00221FC228|nr:uncharacterized protein EV154DRAFT_489425 [Mucor mucedo]KAI7897242.1 hypothetical protein EV154DRAFT_489425 [Mucor mucedo]